MTNTSVKEIAGAALCILLDIEGTTTSIDFVKNELFPYAEEHLAEYIKEHWETKELQDVIGIIKEEAAQSTWQNLPGFIPLPSFENACERDSFQKAIIANVKWQMANDLKVTGLKKLQGYIWKDGYENGLIKGHVYEDVNTALQHWKQKGKKICIYSSGSIQAQKLLFHYSTYGDLDKFIDGNFDTTIGSKLDSASYLKIGNEVSEEPKKVLFFTDRPKEIFAAKKSGMMAILVVRDPNHILLKEEKDFLGHEDGTVNSFLEVIEES